MKDLCEFCVDDTEGKYYLEHEAPGRADGGTEHTARVLCRRHARAVREALLLLDETHTSERAERGAR